MFPLRVVLARLVPVSVIVVSVLRVSPKEDFWITYPMMPCDTRMKPSAPLAKTITVASMIAL